VLEAVGRDERLGLVDVAHGEDHGYVLVVLESAQQRRELEPRVLLIARVRVERRLPGIEVGDGVANDELGSDMYSCL
jgi:hypothetical protein